MMNRELVNLLRDAISTGCMNKLIDSGYYPDFHKTFIKYAPDEFSWQKTSDLEVAKILLNVYISRKMEEVLK